ncbi:MAG TPA: MarR family transcriptional regulator [Steroidobacteraceae bacterium]|nr:MarR family transcriptional regulator [Steroidobacteraceae bacterium]
MKTTRSMARELSAHFHVIREKLHGIDKHNAATAQVINFQEAHLLMSIGTKGPLTMSEIARTLQLTLSSVTAVVDKLEKKKFVRRVRTARDRRLVRVELTVAGRKFYNLVEAAHLTLTDSMLKILDPAEREVFLGLFRKISQSLVK